MIVNESEAEHLWSPKSIVILDVLICISGPNLVILAWTGDKLSCRQTQNGINLVLYVKFELGGQGRSPSKTIGILTVLRCISGPNLVILAWTGDELTYRQAQNEVKFEFQVKFDLEGQGRSPPRVIGFLTKVFCTFTQNLMMLAWTSGELSRGQARVWYTHTDTRTHRHTDAGNDNTRRPKLASGKNATRLAPNECVGGLVQLKCVSNVLTAVLH